MEKTNSRGIIAKAGHYGGTINPNCSNDRFGIKETTTLIVFGAGHLTGPDGVIQMLRDEDIKWNS